MTPAAADVPGSFSPAGAGEGGAGEAVGRPSGGGDGEDDGFARTGLAAWRRRTLAVVGLGQIGGSLAAAARPLAGRVLGLDRDPAAVAYARRSGWVDAGSSGGFELVAEADAVVLAVPISALEDVMAGIRPYLRPGTLVTDTASVKAPVVAAARRLFPHGVAFAGGHPMAGTERWGAGAADPALFRGRTWVLTPAAPWGEPAAAPWASLLAALGARVLFLNPGEHDRHVALTSHLPLLVAAALAGTARRAAGELPHLADLVAGGFRDTTRVAGGHPLLGRDMLRANWTQLAPWFELLREELDRLARLAACPEGPSGHALTGRSPVAAAGDAAAPGAVPASSGRRQEGSAERTAAGAAPGQQPGRAAAPVPGPVPGPAGPPAGDPLYRYLEGARRFRAAVLKTGSTPAPGEGGGPGEESAPPPHRPDAG